MKYKNIKTGAIINSPFKINGTNWTSLEETVVIDKQEIVNENNSEHNGHIEETENIEDSSEDEELEDVSVDDEHYADVTVKDIKRELDSLGIKYPQNAAKPVLYKLMMSQGM